MGITGRSGCGEHASSGSCRSLKDLDLGSGEVTVRDGNGVLNRGGRGVQSPRDRLRGPVAAERADLGRPAGRPSTVEAS